MLLAPPTPMSTIFWQWINQTYNACLNYGNRNASSEQTNEQLATAYGIAVGSSITAALCLRKILTPLGVGRSPMVASLVNYGTSWGAVALAGFCNFYALRKGELETGIQVKPLNSDEDFGMS